MVKLCTFFNISQITKSMDRKKVMHIFQYLFYLTRGEVNIIDYIFLTSKIKKFH